jgi:hypothetical protein
MKQELDRRQLLSSVAKTAGVGAAAFLLPFPLNQRRAKGAERPFQFKYAICNETFGDWPLEKAFAFAAECGYQGIEIAPFTIADYATDISETRRAEIRRLAEKAGLTVVGLHWLLAKTKGRASASSISCRSSRPCARSITAAGCRSRFSTTRPAPSGWLARASSICGGARRKTRIRTG